MVTLNSFPNNADEEQGAEDVMRWLHGRTSGVYGENGNAAVSAVEGSMAVSVSAGIGWMTDSAGNGVVWWFNAAQELEVEAAEPTGTLGRIDRVVIQWRTVDYADKPELVILKGTSSSSPSAPALTNSSTLRQISLARISIPAGTTELTPLLVTDERTDPAVCGIVTETVSVDTTGMHEQYEAALAELRSAIAEAWSGEISAGAVSTLYTATIPVSGWSDGVNVVSVSGILASDNPIIDVDMTNASDMSELQEAWGNVLRITTGNGSLTVHAVDAPEVDIPIRILCIRK